MLLHTPSQLFNPISSGHRCKLPSLQYLTGLSYISSPPKETSTSLLEKPTASDNDVSFTGLIFPPTLLQDSPSLFWPHASGLFASHPSQQILCIPGGSDGNESDFNEGDPSLIPESGRSPGDGNGCPLQYSCLENSIDRGTWPATVHRVAKSQTQLSDCQFTFQKELWTESKVNSWIHTCWI